MKRLYWLVLLAFPAFAAFQPINVGTNPNDGTGTTLRNGGIIINDNFQDLYAFLYAPIGGDVSILSGTNTSVINVGAVTDAKASLANKPSAYLASSANIATLSGLPTIDGVTMTRAGVVLLFGQTTQSQNGPWCVPSSGAWTRCPWYPTGGTTQAFVDEMIQIRGGATYKGSFFNLATPTTGTITIDTTATTWTQNVVAGSGSTFYSAFQAAGGLCNDTHDDGTAFSTALATYTNAARGAAVMPPGLTCKINTGFTITSSLASVDFNGTVLDATGMTTGCIAVSGAGCYAMVLQPNPSSPYFQNSIPAPIKDFVLLLPIATTSSQPAVDGLFSGLVPSATNGSVSGQALENFFIKGGRDCIYIGNAFYINSVFNGHCSNSWRYGINYNAASNSGENFNWHGGQISNTVDPQAVLFTGAPSGTSGTLAANWTLPTGTYPVTFSDNEVQPTLLTNGATTADWSAYGTALTGTPTAAAQTTYGGIAVYMVNNGGGVKDMFLYGVSLDYNDAAINDLGGGLDCFACHIEDNHYEAPYLINIVEGNASSPTGVRLFGGSLTEFDKAPTRVNTISVTSYATKAYFKANARFNIFNVPATLVYTLGRPAVDLTGSDIDFVGAAGQVPNIGSILNTYYNPGFELGTLAGWLTNGFSTSSTVGWTVTADTTTPHSGTYAAKITSTGTVNGNLAQQTVVRPGQRVTYRIWENLTAITSGSVLLTISFLDQSGQYVISTNTLSTLTAPTAGYIQLPGTFLVPSQAAYALLNVSGTFAGTLFVDDGEMEVF